MPASRLRPRPVPFALVRVTAVLGRQGPAPTAADVAWLGVDVQDADSGGPRVVGNGCAQVVEVLPGSPAERARLEPGDWVYTIDDEFVEDAEHLRELLAGAGPDRRVRISLLRWRLALDRADALDHVAF